MYNFRSQVNNKAGQALTLHAVNLGSVPGTPYVSQALSGIILGREPLSRDGCVLTPSTPKGMTLSFLIEEEHFITYIICHFFVLFQLMDI